ncbi:ATP-dependent helicase [Corynebacterium guangdongense]|uniref:DNA 3'-5' helicase n=1 Tax=Corynebacterium guangdongense TaxID=1783348 RepID=A0ABU1ZV28_9CORY|nr:ATP-dependent DNA helicase [Corynebacterium guangdongense]MDR7328720.1 superfamily I DNA/RNA helicase/RecB family exonuclease [Corynebacterium guangdongense]WJZ17297.1 ATP-dependent DNA helicase UvrD1 [Corynebacterium guangdongense]
MIHPADADQRRTRPVLPPNPGVRLVERTSRSVVREWPGPLPGSGRWRVTGAAGSGVSGFLVDTVLAKIRSGADPDGILVVATSKEAGARLRRALVDGLTSEERAYVAKAPLVRSVHSLAFALLRTAHDEPIRMITGADQDSVIQELLAGHAEDGRGDWPEDMRPALTYVGFARQLRDLLLRSAERGLTGPRLTELGRAHRRPLWEAAGRFQTEYDQILSLADSRQYSASELVAAVLDTDAPERHHWHTVVVDDAQHLDPKSGELITRIMGAGPGDLTVVGGDPMQSVFRFRGASTAFLEDFEPDEGNDVDLGQSRRNPRRRAVVVDSDSTQRDLIADAVRRAHLEEGIPWSDVAVIVRSAGQLGPVRRALLAAGVPVHVDPTDVVLAEQHIVSALLLGVRALTERVSHSELESLILGPVGGADPVTLRRLLRGLRRHNPGLRGMETLSDLLAPDVPLPDFEGFLTDRELSILHRLREVLDAGRAALKGGGSVEEILWALWEATDLSDRLMAAALRGGATGSQADRDLDAMMSLFDAAGDYAERNPTATIASFVRHIEDQELPTGVRDRRSAVPEAVSLLTAHGAVGQEYACVIVTGVEEGVWPSLGETGSLFAQEDLIDLLDEGIAPDTPVSHTPGRLAEERRLFHVAVTRATDRLLVTAINNLGGNEPVEASRFVREFADAHELEIADHAPKDAGDTDYEEFSVRILTPSSLIAELRRSVTSPAAAEAERVQAARQLARLAAEGVAGADPEEWWSTTEPSTSERLPEVRALSPSRIEGLMKCSLREVLARLDEEAETPIAMSRGTLAHAHFEALGRGVDPELSRRLTMAAYADILDEPEWRTGRAKEEFERILVRIEEWLAGSEQVKRLIGVEVPVNVQVTDAVGIRGRIDRLEEDAEGGVYIIDLKTGKTPVSKEQASQHPQLAAYQLALSRGTYRDGAVVDPDPGDELIDVALASLVYPANTNKAVPTREQVTRSPQEHEELAARLPELAEELRGPTLTARVNDTCTNCPVRAICPLQPEGKTLFNA